jgi:DNA-binding FadR family transcriptional regulator
MFPLLIEVLADLLRESRQMIFQVTGAPQRGQVWHRRIYAAVEKHDTQAAQEAMRQHLQQVADDARASGYPKNGD